MVSLIKQRPVRFGHRTDQLLLREHPQVHPIIYEAVVLNAHFDQARGQAPFDVGSLIQKVRLVMCIEWIDHGKEQAPTKPNYSPQREQKVAKGFRRLVRTQSISHYDHASKRARLDIKSTEIDRGHIDAPARPADIQRAGRQIGSCDV